MYGYFDDSINIYIIMEVALGGQLYKQLKRGTPMPEPKIAIIMRQVVSAINELHSNQIIHRDIKP
jgi:serine/threonine protein kinase